jgi:DNA-binding beta-propeller fold protein YncE
MAAIAAVVAVLAIAGGAYALLGRGSGGGGPAVALPGCTTKAASTPVLSKVRQASVPVSGSPFAVQVGRGGQYTFVSVGNSVVMLKNGSGLGLTPFRTIAAPGAVKGEAITHNGKYLLVANNGDGAVVISVAMAKHGASNPVLGRLSSPGGKGAVEIALSPDDRFAFVTLQGSAEMAVFNLQQAKASGWRHSGFAGFVPLGIQPVGITESRGWLYVTSFQRNLSTTQGTISVVSMKTAETKPGRAAVVSTAGAGCSPARVALAPNGVLWVTARESNMLLAFSAAKLRTDPAHALLARVAVGQEPIGEMLIRSGSRIVVADSDYHNVANSAPSLAVVDTKKALAGKPALVGLIKTGRVPRQFDLEKDGKTLLVTNQGSHLVQAISVATIP